jgi:hypothetical protein
MAGVGCPAAVEQRSAAVAQLVISLWPEMAVKSPVRPAVTGLDADLAALRLTTQRVRFSVETGQSSSSGVGGGCAAEKDSIRQTVFHSAPFGYVVSTKCSFAMACTIPPNRQPKPF